MTHLIDKDALVAEIKRLQGVLQDPAMNRESMQDYVHGGNKIIKEILSFINTLEVKEVEIATEQKEQMMKDAIEGKIVGGKCDLIHFKEGISDYRSGDKIIIIKE